ncbi:TolC family protein [Brevundimonas kwangchunensis]|uniref:TolC family protein n=1 Tax=Brevundimonas kwangchunensis TaxID=322163 RepID=A0ABN1H322_9CAUL
MKLKNGIGKTLLVAMAASGLIVPAPAWSSPLENAVIKGLGRHPEVRLAEAELSMAMTEVAMVRNGYLPAVNGSAGPNAGGLSYDVTVSQTLHDWGQTGSQVDQARARAAQRRAQLDAVRDEVSLEIVEVYLDVASSRAQLSLLDGHLQRLSELNEMARTRVEGQYSDQSETGRVALAVATAAGQQARIRGSLATAADHYALLVDEPPNGVQLPEPPRFLEDVSDEGALEAAVAVAPMYRKAVMEVAAAEAGVRNAQASRWPRLALEGGVQRREIGGRLVDDTSVGVRFRMATQQGFTAMQRPELERQRREAAVWAAETTARGVMRTIGALLAAEAALDGRIHALSDQVEQSDAVRHVYREQFLVGRRDIQDLVIMETEHFEAQRQLIELTIERLRLQYRGAAQLGQLTPAMVGDELQPVGDIL